MSPDRARIEPNTIDEVLRTGRELATQCLAMSPAIAPDGLRRAAIDLQVMLNELEGQTDVT